MAEQKATFEVELGGMPLKLKSSHEKEFVEKLVRQVDSKVQEALMMNKNIPYQKALLLAALHIAEENHFLKSKTLEELERLESQALTILSDLESSPATRIRFEA